MSEFVLSILVKLWLKVLTLQSQTQLISFSTISSQLIKLLLHSLLKKQQFSSKLGFEIPLQQLLNCTDHSNRKI